MKAVIITTLGLMLSSGLAYAADTQSPSGPTSGHPTVLTDTECNGVWMDAVSGGDVLTGDKAGGYISDFKQADADPRRKDFTNRVQGGLQEGFDQT